MARRRVNKAVPVSGGDEPGGQHHTSKPYRWLKGCAATARSSSRSRCARGPGHLGRAWPTLLSQCVAKEAARSSLRASESSAASADLGKAVGNLRREGGWRGCPKGPGVVVQITMKVCAIFGRRIHQREISNRSWATGFYDTRLRLASAVFSTADHITGPKAAIEQPFSTTSSLASITAFGPESSSWCKGGEIADRPGAGSAQLAPPSVVAKTRQFAARILGILP